MSAPGGLAGTVVVARRSWVLGIVALSWFLVLLDDTAAAIALPALGRDLGLGLSGLEWVINIYTLAFAVLTLWGGMCTDRFGARPVFLTGLVVFTMSSLAAGLSVDGAMLIGTRAAQGAGAALMGPAALSLLLALFTGPGRGLALGIWSGVGATALAGGPLAGAALTRGLGWQAIFLVNVPLGAVMLAAGFLGLPRATPTRPRPARVDLPGLVFSAVGLTGLVVGLTQAGRLGWTSPVLWAVLGAAAAGIAAFVVVERRSSAPLLDLALFRRPNFLAGNVLGLLNLAVMCSLFFFLSLYLQTITGAPPLQVGLVLLPLTLFAGVLAPVAGWLVPRVGCRVLITGGMALTAAGLALLAGIDSGWGMWQLLPGLLLAGTGIGLSSTPITTSAMDHIPDDRAGIAGAAHNTFRMVGLSLGIAVMGAIVTAQWPGDLAQASRDPERFTIGVGVGFLVNAALALIAAGVALATIRTGRATRSI